MKSNHVQLQVVKTITSIAILFLLNIVEAQVTNFKSIANSAINLGEVKNNNEDFKEFSKLKPLLEDVEIVMLGEQSHGDGTAYQTKIKLIKYLHQELGFDYLVFESGFFECKKAWEEITKDGDVRDVLGRSVFTIWSTTKEFKPLAAYIDTQKDAPKPLKIAGFDSQFTGKLSTRYFLNDLNTYLQKTNPDVLKTESWAKTEKSFNLLTKLTRDSFKALKKKDFSQELVFISKLITTIETVGQDSESQFWAQTLKSTKAYIQDLSMKTDFRDKQMADNLIWLKEKYPDSKFICWGATSHFLYNSKNTRIKNPVVQLLAGNHYKKTVMMGEYIKDKYQEKVYTIGFTAYQGEFGYFSRRKIRAPKEGSLEYVLGQSNEDNFLVPLSELNVAGLESRPLANFYMKNDIDGVMDAVIFNRNMHRPKLDRNLFLQIYPENKYIKPEAE